MPKNYQDLSRRGLIKLNTDFDAENGNKLHDYLSENESNYEGIRPVEKIIERCDEIKDTVTGSGNALKAGIMKGVDNVLDKVINSLTSMGSNG